MYCQHCIVGEERNGEGDLLDDYSNADCDPAEIACHTYASLQIALENEECDGAPEDDLETADDHVGFVAVPAFDLLHMLRCQHVGEKYERFGSLAAVSVMIRCLLGLCVPFRGR